MTHEDPEGDLIERALAEWDVPEPPPDLTDRILSHNTDALATLSRPRAEEPRPLASLAEETPTMLPTEHRSSSSLRPFWTATLVGFAAAAVLLLAFTAGRESVSDTPLSPSVPQVEIKVTAPPAPATSPPATPEAAGSSRVIYVEETKPPEPPEAPEAPEVLETPQAPEAPKSKRTKRSSSDLKSPFTDDMALLRIGTLPGVAPAEVYVDGKRVGSTPLSRVRVKAGKHTVRFEWPNGAVQEQHVAVAADRSIIVRGNMPE